MQQTYFQDWADYRENICDGHLLFQKVELPLPEMVFDQDSLPGNLINEDIRRSSPEKTAYCHYHQLIHAKNQEILCYLEY